MANAIITENLNTGTTAWRYTNKAVTEIQAYADKLSYNPGDTASFYVSTKVASTTYTVTIYRLGYYQGKGGCLKYTSTTSTGIAQGYWDPVGLALNNDSNSVIDSTTHRIEAGWTVTDIWAIPSNAVTGYYMANFTDSNGKQGCVMFVVKGNAGADYLFEKSCFTDAPYNNWGGYSLYTSPSVGVKVSFNRPLTSIEYAGTGYSFQFDLAALHWVEMMGYNLSYATDLDVHLNPSMLLNYKAILYAGHNEYWTKAMRDGAEAAIAAGVSAAFLGADASYWQARLETDSTGNANRTLVCYKVGTGLFGNAALAKDPQYGVNNNLVTCLWRDACLNRPENTMIGIMFSSYVNNSLGNNYHWTTDTSMDTTYTAGTGLVANTSYGSDLVGYEWDKIQTGGPSNLKTIATTSVTDLNSVADTSNTTFYRAPSGALVFATGSVAWTSSLDTFRALGSAVAVIPGMQVLFANIMGALKGPVYGKLGGH